MFNVIRKAQTDRFSMDIARAVAPRNAVAAFAGGAVAYGRLGEADRDELLSLVDAHGDWKQEDVLAAFANDTSKKAAQRRIRAIEIAGRVAPRGSSAPSFVIDAVGTSRPDLLAATFTTVANLQPRDVTLARRLRAVAELEGALGRSEARTALETLTAAYADQLSAAETREEWRLLLALLGATARTTSIDKLLRYVGGDAEDDHPSVKQAAAEALNDAAAAVRFDPTQIQRLGNLIDGPLPEGDPTARALLADALGKATLGEDRALQVLFDLVGRPVKGDPDHLFGQEKSRLLRHAALFKTSESRGKLGGRESFNSSTSWPSAWFARHTSLQATTKRRRNRSALIRGSRTMARSSTCSAVLSRERRAHCWSFSGCEARRPSFRIPARGRPQTR